MPKLQASGAFAQALDDNARALNGAYWKVYAAGTTTQATTYSNALLTIANAWPVIGDAAGRLPDIYVAPGNYRIRVETAGGVLIAESDNNVVYGLDPGEVAAAKFKTVAILKADETMGYALGGDVSVVVASGDMIEAGGFPYSVLASGATTQDLTTTGGVKLQALPDSTGSVSLPQLGALPGEANMAVTTAVLVHAVKNFDKVFVPEGQWWCSKTLNIKRTLNLYGVNGSGQNQGVLGNTWASELVFENGIIGIFAHRNNTFASDTGVPVYPSTEPGEAEGFSVSFLKIRTRAGQSPTSDGTSHGIWMKAKGQIHDCYITGWGGNGIHIVATSTSSDPLLFGNANNSDIARVRCDRCENGIYVEGRDTNVITGLHVDCTLNRQVGLVDSSLLGCTWISPHFAANEGGAILHTGTVSSTVFLHPYVEPFGNNARVRLTAPGVIVGGQLVNVTIEKAPGANPWDFIQVQGNVMVGPRFGFEGARMTSREANPAGSKLDQVWNQAVITPTYGAGHKFTCGVPGGAVMDVGSVYGTGGGGGINDVSKTGRVCVDVYNPATPGFERALTFRGEVRRLEPGGDNLWGLGGGANRFTTIFATNGTINTSDEREKQEIRDVSDAERAVAQRIKPRAFRWKSGDPKMQIGVIAQEVIAAFAAEGLDAMKYGCVHECEETGRLGVRIDQILALMLSAMAD